MKGNEARASPKVFVIKGLFAKLFMIVFCLLKRSDYQLFLTFVCYGSVNETFASE